MEEAEFRRKISDYRHGLNIDADEWRMTYAQKLEYDQIKSPSPRPSVSDDSGPIGIFILLIVGVLGLSVAIEGNPRIIFAGIGLVFLYFSAKLLFRYFFVTDKKKTKRFIRILYFIFGWLFLIISAVLFYAAFGSVFHPFDH